MVKQQAPLNNHIEDYLEYYSNLPYAPHFAVLLKGEWGSGKTWFIKKFIEKTDNPAASGKGNTLTRVQEFLEFFTKPIQILGLPNAESDTEVDPKKLKTTEKKTLYISLYGMTNFDDIEYAFFEQLHPFWSKKEVMFAGRIFRGCLKSQETTRGSVGI
jgi:hypothetical protein